MRARKQTAVPAETPNVSNDSGEIYVHNGPRDKSKRNAVGHQPDADEEPGRKTMAAPRGRVNRRARYARLTTGGKAASMDDVQHGSAIKHPAEQPDLLARQKQTLDNDERRSEDRGRRHREKSPRSESPGKRAMPGWRPSYREAVLEEPEAVATPLMHKRLLAPQLQDQERQTTETELLSSATEKDKYSEQKAAMEVESPAVTKTPRSATEVLSEEGGSSISAGGARKSGQSTETTGLNRTDMSRAILVTILCAAFVAVMALLARLIAAHKLDGAAFTASTWLKEMDEHCNSPDCLIAIKFIAAAMNVSANPCTNFYVFACGHWRSFPPATTNESDWTSPADRNVSYMASLRSDYVAASNEILLRVAQGSATSDEQVSDMGKVYASCLAFFVDKPLNLMTAWQAANIYTNLWLEAKTFQESFFLAVTHLLNFRLDSVLYAAYKAQVVHISPGTAILHHVKAGFRRAIVVHAVKALLPNYGFRQRSNLVDGATGDDQMVDAIVKLDDVVFNQTDTSPPVEIGLSELDSSKWNWTEVFTAYSSVEHMALPIKARVTNIAGVRAILDSLSSQEDMMATKIYLMLVPLAKFFGLEERARVHRRIPKDDIRNELCVTAVETMFGDVYQRWMTAELVGSDTGADLRRMLSDVLKAADKVLEITRGGALDYGKMVAATYPARSRAQLRHCRVLLGQASLLGRMAVARRWERQVTPNMESIRLKVIDKVHANSSAAWDLTEHTHCLASYAKQTSGIEMSGDEPWWRDAVQVRWAAEVSFRASAFRDANIAQERSLRQLFFLRFGHTFCAVPQRGHWEAAATACRVATMTLPAFAGAFGCPAMVGIGC
ncbi:uncharacterized protein [Dermacentor albipictus]|uniref:uncharacterized protein isoform X2 n=1 Tax=Dermacentor albipictus TaxID=60249 RepID=UPI0038FCD3A5